LPGGKAEPGETALQTLRRELAEELALSLEDRDLESLGQFRAPAANEPNHQVQAQVFVGRLPHPVSVQAEIEEMGWLDLEPCHRDDIAPLLRTQVLPALLLPGGKAEPGETALQTLRRELAEELALSLEDRD
ncbi:NUDIX domain-containing protein, partial [Acinetobacter baumannii]|uniref:NUDIX domain-containing protein n=1 Tax=Acinetobacter baumannii TaxID=470 RepID=UPI0011779747